MTDGPSGPLGLVTEIPKDTEGADFAPGDGPLPPGAEDGFDPNVLLDPATGKVVYKTDSEKTTTKRQRTGIPGGAAHIHGWEFTAEWHAVSIGRSRGIFWTWRFKVRTFTLPTKDSSPGLFPRSL